MKKRQGLCPRCGQTTVGVKTCYWGGRKSLTGDFIGNPQKAGSVKCLSCQRCDGVTAR